MKIELKQRNRPRKPGRYICQRYGRLNLYVAEIRKEKDGLWMYHGLGAFPLKRCEKDALWSDEITFV